VMLSERYCMNDNAVALLARSSPGFEKHPEVPVGPYPIRLASDEVESFDRPVSPHMDSHEKTIRSHACFLLSEVSKINDSS
jgi:hypothetical protein